MFKARHGLVVIVCAAMMAYAGAARAVDGEKIVVFAAASLKNAIDDIAADFQRRKAAATVRVSYAGSSKLARQIEQGAPADLFISANVQWMDVLARKKLIDPATRRALISNRLVLIAHGKGSKPIDIVTGFDLARLVGDGRLAMAMVDAVPAGIYGKAALTSLGVWDKVAARVAQADNVRAALALVARGEAPYGIVYASDAMAENAVTVVGAIPPRTHPAIIYPAAVTAESRHAKLAQAFLDYLSTPAAHAAFERHGFRVLAPSLAN